MIRAIKKVNKVLKVPVKTGIPKDLEILVKIQMILKKLLKFQKKIYKK